MINSQMQIVVEQLNQIHVLENYQWIFLSEHIELNLNLDCSIPVKNFSRDFLETFEHVEIDKGRRKTNHQIPGNSYI